MQKLSQLTAPALAGVVRETTVNAAIGEMKNCRYHGADMIDLHMSCLEDTSVESLGKIISSCKLPTLALNYNFTINWENAGYSEEDRAQCFLRAVDAGAAGIDMQGYTFHLPSKEGFCGEDKYSFTKGNPKEVVTDEAVISKQCELIEKVHSKGAEVLLSCHPGIVMNSTQIVELALFLEKRNPDIIKMVTRVTNDDEFVDCIKAMTLLKKEVKTPVSYHTVGHLGSLSRIVNPILGGQIIFCVDSFKESSTMGQLDLRTTREIIDGLKKII